MKTYEVPMQESGRVILPSDLRKTLGLTKGDRVLIEADGDVVVLTTEKLRRRRARAMVAQYVSPSDNVVDEFLAEKRVEADREVRGLGIGSEMSGTDAVDVGGAED